MGTAGKVILGIFAAIVLVIVLVVAVVAYFWSDIKKFANQTAESVQQGEKEGEKFGMSVEDKACVDETLARSKRSKDFQSALSSQIFVQGCLRTSKETPDFCIGVPKLTQIIDGPKWQLEQCRKRGFANDEMCRQIMQKVQEHCFKKS